MDAIARVVTVDISSGRVHTRWDVTERGKTRRMVDERCQTDQSGGYRVVPAAQLDDGGFPLTADVGAGCGYCFP